jgi:hypothetical protein
MRCEVREDGLCFGTFNKNDASRFIKKVYVTNDSSFNRTFDQTYSSAKKTWFPILKGYTFQITGTDFCLYNYWSTKKVLIKKCTQNNERGRVWYEGPTLFNGHGRKPHFDGNLQSLSLINQCESRNWRCNYWKVKNA